MRLHILTAVTRPENLPTIEASLAKAVKTCENPPRIRWDQYHDPQREFVGGQKAKNIMLDRIEDGWVWVLDDDTIVHHFMLRAFEIVLAESQPDAVIFSQMRYDGEVLEASPKKIAVGCIDIGQVIFKKELIGDLRIPERYDGDGYFLCKFLPTQNTVFLDKVLSFHNFLR